ncbi:hypothetical protein [Puia dinghuensis]|uniref:Uncharacterized protein n=1 Tax=Puia dinghuensis TaxID=1792502 RepID=A0A8J2UBB4_9BACT|nr:hypothetical protein [Puia dinghuensis]GGA93215.1 hypothetical protein GCM10011511_15790 [Puia dinghuensis]
MNELNQNQMRKAWNESFKVKIKKYGGINPFFETWKVSTEYQDHSDPGAIYDQDRQEYEIEVPKTLFQSILSQRGITNLGIFIVGIGIVAFWPGDRATLINLFAKASLVWILLLVFVILRWKLYFKGKVKSSETISIEMRRIKDDSTPEANC